MSLLGTLGGILGVVGKVAPGPIGTLAGGIGGVLGGGGGKMPSSGSTSPFPTTATPDSVVTTKTSGGAGYGPLTFGGSTSRTTAYFGGKKRKKVRRMNATNPKALSRAIRRVSKFKDFAKMVGFTHAPKVMKGVHFPKKRSKSCR